MISCCSWEALTLHFVLRVLGLVLECRQNDQGVGPSGASRATGAKNDQESMLKAHR